MTKKVTIRINRAKLIRALPVVLWGAKETARMENKPTDMSKCVGCKNKHYNGNSVCVIHDIYWPIREDVDGHCLAIALKDSQKVSYASKVEHKNDENARVKSSFGRYLRRQLGFTTAQISDTQLAEWQAKIVAVTNPSQAEDAMRILRGDELREAYKNEVGLASCMTGVGRQPLLELYINNPAQVGLLVYTPITGNCYRALLWELEGGSRMLDRIYPADGSAAYEQLLRWARANGYHVHGDSSAKGCPITRLPIGKAKLYPYLDTFRYGRWDGEALLLRPEAPHITENQRRTTWPLYFSENRLLDLNNKPVPCTKCRKSYDKRTLVEGPDKNLYCATCMETCMQSCAHCNTQRWYTEMDSIMNLDPKTGCARVACCKECLKHGIACKHCGETWVASTILANGYDRECDAHLRTAPA